MRHYVFPITDYEHPGDLDWAASEVQDNFPNVRNIHTWEEKDEDGELEGYIEFDAPEEYAESIKDLEL